VTTAISTDIPGAEGWRRLVWMTVVVQLFSMMGVSVTTSFLPLYIQTIGVNNEDRAAFWSGLVIFCQAIMVALCSPIWGALADRVGAKMMVCRALLGCSVIYGAASLVSDVIWLLPLFMIAGCFSGISTAIVTLVSSSVPREQLGSAIGACQTGQFVGIAIGPLVGGVLADQFSYRVGMRGGALLLLAAGAITIFGIREPARTVSAQLRRPGIVEGIRQASRSRALMLLIGVIFLIQFSSTMMSPALPLYVQQMIGDEDRTATIVGIVLAIGGVGSAIGALTCGRGADRFGQRRMLGWATTGGAVMLALQALIAAVIPLALLRGASGLFTGGLNAGTNSTIGTLTPSTSRGAAFGVAGSAFSLGNALGPLLGGALAGLISPRAVIFASAVVLLGGRVLVHLLRRYEQPLPETA
jgi:DHA1 family multidrug resistance protein-like MFS transporter